MALTASNRKGAKIQHDISWFYPKKFFQNIKINLNSRTWWLKSSLVIFQASEPLQSQWPLQLQQPPWPQCPLQPHTDPDSWIIRPGNQMTNTGPFLWIGASKIQILTDIWTISVKRLLRPADVTFFEKWLMKLKCLNLQKPLPPWF